MCLTHRQCTVCTTFHDSKVVTGCVNNDGSSFGDRIPPPFLPCIFIGSVCRGRHLSVCTLGLDLSSLLVRASLPDVAHWNPLPCVCPQSTNLFHPNPLSLVEIKLIILLQRTPVRLPDTLPPSTTPYVRNPANPTPPSPLSGRFVFTGTLRSVWSPLTQRPSQTTPTPPPPSSLGPRSRRQRVRGGGS